MCRSSTGLFSFPFAWTKKKKCCIAAFNIEKHGATQSSVYAAERLLNSGTKQLRWASHFLCCHGFKLSSLCCIYIKNINARTHTHIHTDAHTRAELLESVLNEPCSKNNPRCQKVLGVVSPLYLQLLAGGRRWNYVTRSVCGEQRLTIPACFPPTLCVVWFFFSFRKVFRKCFEIHIRHNYRF